MDARMRTLSFAVLAFLCLLPSIGQAVYLNPEGVGQALIYPYYTAQSVSGSDMNTYVSLVNERGGIKAVRVRFREGRSGREVANFNVLLGTSDAWTAAVVPTSSGAKLVTIDQTCSDPAFTDVGGGRFELELSAAAYSGVSSDGLGTDADRLREGYAEVIQMSSVDGTSGAPLTCEALRNGQIINQGPAFDGLSGTLTLINVATGMDFTADATALAGLTSRSIFRRAADPYPDFDAVEIDSTVGFVDDGRLVRGSAANGRIAVELALTKASISNEFVLDVGSRSATDWIVTFPTKRFHVDASPGDPFVTSFIPGTRHVEAYLSGATREASGGTFQLVNGCGGTCSAFESSADIRLPWASTVWSFRTGAPSATPGTSDVVGSRNALIVTLPTASENGFLTVTFGRMSERIPSTSMSATLTNIRDGLSESGAYASIGLPAVGFMLRTFQNGALSCGSSVCQGNYGGLFQHKWRRSISPR